MTFKLKVKLDHEQSNMQTSNAKQNFSSADPAWVLLADLSLRDFLSDHDQREEPAAGFLFQTLRELGMLPECMENITRLLAGFAKEALVRYKQEGMEFPARIRIFCQKKMIDNANAAHATSRPYHTEQAMEHPSLTPDFGTKMNGGWGCFLIERGGNVSDDSPHVVDLYLYREG